MSNINDLVKENLSILVNSSPYDELTVVSGGAGQKETIFNPRTMIVDSRGAAVQIILKEANTFHGDYTVSLRLSMQKLSSLLCILQDVVQGTPERKVVPI